MEQEKKSEQVDKSKQIDLEEQVVHTEVEENKNQEDIVVDSTKNQGNEIWKPLLCIVAVIAIIIALTQTVTAPKVNPAGVSPSPQTIESKGGTHAEIKFQDMQYVRFDPASLYADIEKVKTLAKENGKQEELFSVYESILSQYDEMNTMLNLNDIYYYGDNNNEYYAEEQKYMHNTAEEVRDVMGTMMKTVLDSEYGDAFREKIGEYATREFQDYKELTQEQKTLLEREKELVQEYEKKIMEDVTVTLDGETWDNEKLGELGESKKDIKTSVAVLDAMEKEKNKEVVNIYKNLVDIRNQLAVTYGYDNYIVYANEKVYDRDFSEKQIKNLEKYVEEYVASLYQYYAYYWGDGIANSVYEIDAWDSEKIVNTIKEQVGKISPELSDVYDYMLRNNLYDIAESDTKMNMGFTTKLASYQAPYIFDSPYGSYFDIKTMIHEFGHYNNFYQITTPSLYGESCLDVAEIHSQGLELLFLPYYNEMFGDISEDMEHCLVVDLLSGIIDGCIYNEFERIIYENPDMSVEQINKKFYEISAKYGKEEEGTYDWIETPHIFQSPFYYISYATSGLSAFDLWQESLTDRESAVEKYIALTKMGSDVTFLKGLEQNNMQNIFEEDYFIALYEAIDMNYVVEEEEEIDIDGEEDIQEIDLSDLIGEDGEEIDLSDILEEE